MDSKQYFKELNNKLDTLSDKKFMQLLKYSGIERTPLDNSCQNCGECICLSCKIRDNCRCDGFNDLCEDKPLKECNRKIDEID